MTISSNCALRLPASLMREVEKMATLRTLDFFAEWAARGIIGAALEIMNSPGGEPPRADDKLVGS